MKKQRIIDAMGKNHIFLIGLFCLMVIFVMMWISEDPTQYGSIIAGVVSLTTLSIAGRVVDSGVKGKTWNNDYFNATSGEEEVNDKAKS